MSKDLWTTLRGQSSDRFWQVSPESGTVGTFKVRCRSHRWRCPVDLISDRCELPLSSILLCDSSSKDCDSPTWSIIGPLLQFIGPEIAPLYLFFHSVFFTAFFGRACLHLLYRSCPYSGRLGKRHTSMQMICRNYRSWALISMDSMLEEWARSRTSRLVTRSCQPFPSRQWITRMWQSPGSWCVYDSVSKTHSHIDRKARSLHCTLSALYAAEYCVDSALCCEVFLILFCKFEHQFLCPKSRNERSYFPDIWNAQNWQAACRRKRWSVLEYLC